MRLTNKIKNHVVFKDTFQRDNKIAFSPVKKIIDINHLIHSYGKFDGQY